MQIGTANKINFTDIGARMETDEQRSAVACELIERGFDTIELKADGCAARMVVDGRRCDIYSRSGAHKGTIRLSAGGGRAVLYGEFMHGTHWSRGGNRAGMFYAFDVQMDGERPHCERRQWLERLVGGDEDFEGLGKLSGGLVACVPNWSFASSWLIMGVRLDCIWREYVLGQGWEGLVAKRSEGAFGDDCIRIKRRFEVDYVCMGFNRRPSGAVKSVIGGLYKGGKLTGAVNAGSLYDWQRGEMAAHAEQYVGRVFRAAGFAVYPSGALRHPSFVDWHADKGAQACTLSAALSVGGYGNG